MISEELKVIVDKFKQQGKMHFLDETTKEKILAFEKENDVTLPSKGEVLEVCTAQHLLLRIHRLQKKLQI